MDIKAHLKNVRLSSRKAKLVLDLIRGRKVEQALNILKTLPQISAKTVLKLVMSAVANAKSNHSLVADTLWVKSVFANQGPRLKRFKPRAMGRATPIHKPTAHLTVVLTDKSGKTINNS